MLILSYSAISQSRLMAWGMDDVEGLTEQIFNDAIEIGSEQWLVENKSATTWKDVLLAMSNVAKHKTNIELLLSFAEQITDTTTTKLKGTSRLIIWDRILTKDIIFEGKGIVIENDLFTVAGRTNQILQSALAKNFGYVTIDTDYDTLKNLKEKWIRTIHGEEVEEWEAPKLNYENTIEEITNLKAFEAIIFSVQPSVKKELITSNCLKNIYKLDAMPENPGSEAFCNPDTYSFSYLGMLVGKKPVDKSKDYKYWKEFWNENKNSLTWDNEKGHFVTD